jgi:hypothetical protein
MFRRIYNAIVDALSQKKINEAMETIPKEIEVCVDDYAFATASIEVTLEGTYLIKINTRAIMNLIHQYGFSRTKLGDACIILIEHEVGHWLTSTLGDIPNLAYEEAAWSAGIGFCGVDIDNDLRKVLMKFGLDSYEAGINAGHTISGGAVV